ncbi:hypothetical protein BQ8794_60288 [Mesorhizobium prunaredense]|uniref:Uncharacterized protein n=1 Tax=Mesorhizobium prunaredense TaxID=1631249 RepID=A0A1R3VGL6_9HYPH|nr:hypothetical protein BQ8794_60288 [Mesorhizobium prunaredense]
MAARLGRAKKSLLEQSIALLRSTVLLLPGVLDGATSFLERLSEAFAGDLPGRDDARYHRERKSPVPYAQSQERASGGQPICRCRQRQARC